MEMHFGRSVLVVHPQGPNHFWQGIENGAIDGTEIFEGLGLTTLIQRQSPTSDFLKDGPQVLGGKDFGSFAQRSQRSGANAQKTLHFFQLGGTLQRPHAFDNRIEKIQQQQGGVLVEEQFAIPRFVARSPHRLESFQERKQHVEIFEAFEIGLANLGLTRTGQQSTLGMQLPAWQQPGRLRPIPDTPARFVPNARKIVEK